MIKKVIIFSLLFLSCNTLFAQLSIEDCYKKAQANFPLIKQYDLIERAKSYNLSNASKGYLPQVTFSAKATYQSEVTEVPFILQGTSPLKRDQYNMAVDVNQVVWDGGVIKAKKEGINASSEVDAKNLAVELYSLNDRVNQLYFGIMLLEAQIEQNKLYSEELQRNYKKVESCVQNGIANRVDLDIVKVEQLKTIQNMSTLTHSKSAYLSMLSAMIGEKIEDSVTLIKPVTTTKVSTVVARAELELFKAQINNFETQNRQLQTSLRPQLGVYVSGGYGRPGLNMLKNNFSGFYVAGAKMTWNIGNLYTNKNNKRLIHSNINSVITRQQTFLFNTNLDITNRQSEINNCREQLKYDNQIIELRMAVKASSEVKMDNGTISVTDYMRDVNAEELAKQDKILHEIKLIQAIYTLKYITNN